MRQKGYTLLELLVVLSITGVLLTVVVSTTFMIIRNISNARNQGIVSTGLDQATIRIRKDINSAHTTNLTTDNVTYDSILLQWTDYTDTGDSISTPHSVAYTLSASNATLMRNHDSGNVTIAGRYIKQVSFRKIGRLVYVTVTASSNTTASASKAVRIASETISFSAYMRSQPPTP